MTDHRITNPHSAYVDPETGDPVAGGSIYIGAQDLNPKTEANRKQVYVRQESGSDVPIPQPVKISQGGYAVYGGAIASIRTNGSYSMLIEDRYGAQVFYSPNVKRDLAISVFPSYASAKPHNIPEDVTVLLTGMDSELDGAGGTYVVKAQSNLDTSLPLDNGMFLVLVEGGSLDSYLNKYAGAVDNMLDNSHLEIQERYLAKYGIGSLMSTLYVTDQVATFNTVINGGRQLIQSSDTPEGFNYALSLTPEGGKRAIVRLPRPLDVIGRPEPELIIGSELAFQCYVKSSGSEVEIDIRSHKGAQGGDADDTSLIQSKMIVPVTPDVWNRVFVKLKISSPPSTLSDSFSVNIYGAIGATMKVVGWDLKPVPFQTPIRKKRRSQELLECMSFWEKSYSAGVRAGDVSIEGAYRLEASGFSGANDTCTVDFKVMKHKKPNVILLAGNVNGTWVWYNLSKGTPIRNASIKSSESSFSASRTSGEPQSAGDEIVFQWVADSSL